MTSPTDGAVRHINLTNDQGKIYCHKGSAISELDGLHLAGMCWACPYLAGLKQGYGVECLYDDPNVGPNIDEVTFSNPEDAMQAAPERPGNLDSIASDDGIESRDLRMKLASEDGIDGDGMDQTDNLTTPPTREQAQQGEPIPPVMASMTADHNAIVKAALKELDRVMNS